MVLNVMCYFWRHGVYVSIISALSSRNFKVIKSSKLLESCWSTYVILVLSLSAYLSPVTLTYDRSVTGVDSNDRCGRLQHQVY